MVEVLTWLWRWLGLWRQRPLGPFGHGLWTAGSFTVLSILKFYRDRCFSLAASLTFSSLLAVVPVSAMFFSIFSAFPAFKELIERVRRFLMDHLTPSQALKDGLERYLQHFMDNAFGITFISLVAVIATSILLFVTIEDSLNRIYCVRRHPPFLRSLTAYTSFLLWGPVLLSLSGYLWVQAESHQMIHSLLVTAPAIALAPVAVSWLLYLLGYTLLPYTPLELRASLVGAFVAALLWEMAKSAFQAYVARAIVYPTLYGPMALVPLFLLWLYTSWSIFLWGAQIDFLVRSHGMLDVIADGSESDPILVTQTNLAALLAIGRAFVSGNEPPNTQTLAHQLRVPAHVVQEGLLALEERRIVRAINRRKDRFLLARDPDKVPLKEVFFTTLPITHSVDGDSPEAKWVRATLGRVQENVTQTLGEMSLGQLLEELERSPGEAGASPPGSVG